MLKSILLTGFTALAFLTFTTDAKFTAILKNHCSESVDVEFTAGEGRNCGRKTVPAKGEVYAPAECEPKACPAISNGGEDNCGGATMLLHKNGKKLAAEYGSRFDSSKAIVMWYNWSNDDGNPFLDKKRQFHAGGNCPDVDCAPGSDACDYKNHDPPFMSCKPNPYYIEIHVC